MNHYDEVLLNSAASTELLNTPLRLLNRVFHNAQCARIRTLVINPLLSKNGILHVALSRDAKFVFHCVNSLIIPLAKYLFIITILSAQYVKKNIYLKTKLKL